MNEMTNGIYTDIKLRTMPSSMNNWKPFINSGHRPEIFILIEHRYERYHERYHHGSISPIAVKDSPRKINESINIYRIPVLLHMFKYARLPVLCTFFYLWHAYLRFQCILHNGKVLKSLKHTKIILLEFHCCNVSAYHNTATPHCNTIVNIAPSQDMR